MREYRLIGQDGREFRSLVPGTLGGHRRTKVYGRLDCPGALRWIERGHYVSHRVFFADEPTAVAAGHRPCSRCLPGRVGVRTPFDAAALLSFLAARAVPGVERVERDAFHRGAVTIRFDAAGVTTGRRDVAAARRLVDADADPGEVVAALGDDELLGSLVRARPGLRVPGAFSAYEAAVRAIVGQAISVAAARAILGRLAAAGLFPDPGRLAEARPEDLPLPRVRALALIELARGRPLGEIRGVGPWTRDYVALRTGDRDVLLHGDLGVRRAMRRLGGPEDPRAIARIGERWAPYRSIATMHLWASLLPGAIRDLDAKACATPRS
jgi:AraC family transcriptional regulator of adaptative response / DNA-3-methyladenine glycosylase II